MLSKFNNEQALTTIKLFNLFHLYVQYYSQLYDFPCSWSCLTYPRHPSLQIIAAFCVFNYLTDTVTTTATVKIKSSSFGLLTISLVPSVSFSITGVLTPWTEKEKNFEGGVLFINIRHFFSPLMLHVK